EFYSNNRVYSGKAISINYSTIEDKDITATEEDLKKYLKEHADDFKQEASRDLEYVLFDIRPSAEDSATIRQEVASEASAFKLAENDSIFLSLSGSEVDYDSLYHPHGYFDRQYESLLFSAEEDSVLGPVAYNGGYSLFKISGVRYDSVSYYHLNRADIPVRGVTKLDTADAMAAAKKMMAAQTGDFLEYYRSKSQSGEVNSVEDMNWLKTG